MAQIGSFLDRPKVGQNTSASGAASSVALAADTGASHALTAIHLTYNGGVPATKTITIVYTEDGTATTVVIGVAATVSVTNVIELNDRIVGDKNTAITVTGELLGGNTNTLEVFYH